MQAIVAVYENWGIGKDGSQPVVVSADRRHFRELTQGGTVILGRKTLEDFPGGQPLKGRRNVVLSRTVAEIPGATVCSSPAEALFTVFDQKDCFLIGGAKVYRQMLPFCNKVHVTKLYVSPDCDAFFPDLDADPEWECKEEGPLQEEEGVKFRFLTYERK